MSIFDAPIARCEAVHEMVLTDETQCECAREHDCPPDRICPLQGYFTETSGIAEAETDVELQCAAWARSQELLSQYATRLLRRVREEAVV